MRVGGVAADVAHNAELAVGRLEALDVDERRNGLRKINAVYEEIALDDLRVGTVAVLGLRKIPLLDLGAADLLEEVDGPAAAAAKGTQDERAGLATGNLLACSDVLLELCDQLGLVVVVAAAVGEVLDAGEGLAVGVGELPCPGLRKLASQPSSDGRIWYLDG